MRKSDRKYLRVGKAAEELGLHPITIRRWIKTGKIQAVRVGNEARLPRSEIERLLGQAESRVLVLYARVSGHDQRPDLDRQIEHLQVWAKAERAGQEALVLSDIGSGLDAARKRLQQLLKLVCDDRVAEVAITSPDRLTRFGTEYLATLFSSFGVRRPNRNSWKICFRSLPRLQASYTACVPISRRNCLNARKRCSTAPKLSHPFT
jgi:putative resolvase